MRSEVLAFMYVPVPGPRLSPAQPPLHTAREILALEQAFVETAKRHSELTLHRSTPAALASALARDPELSAEQRQMVTRLTTGGEGSVVLLGRAGAGKTRALRPVREAFEASGPR